LRNIWRGKRIEPLSYSRGILLYQDKPRYGIVLKLILLIPAGFLVASIYLWSSGEATASLVLLLEALMIGLIFWLVFPREYRVYEDHLRIVLGGPFSVKVGFENIRAIRTTRKTAFTVNFVTRITKSYVEIAKRRGLSIAITPTANDSFVENANRALEQWLRTKRETGVARF